MKNPEDIVRLSQYLSSRHPNIKFTYEEENNNCEFLDVNVLRDTNRLSTSIHRKHKPVYTNYKSVLPDTYVCKDLLSNLTVSRMKFSSFYHSLHEEVENLQNIFTKNGYKMKLIDRCVKKFLNKIFDHREPSAEIEPKKEVMFMLPFLGISSFNVKNELSRTFRKILPSCKLKVIFKSTIRISSCFVFKDKFLSSLKSGVIYKYK